MTQNYRNIALFLFTMLLVNPAIIYLVTNSIVFVVLAMVTVIATFLIIIKKAQGALVYFINFTCLLGLFLYAEAIFTYSFSEYVIRDLYDIRQTYYFNKPFLRERFSDKEYIVDYVTNAQGYRINAEDDQSREIGQVDWLFLGDSYTQGAQVANEQLFTSLLYHDFPHKVILNAGISGFGLSEELNYFKKEGRKLRPKKVFLQICNFNDFMKVVERQSDFSDYLMNYSNLYRSLLYPIKFENPAELPLGRWTEPFYPTRKLNADYNIYFRQQSEAKKKDLDNFERLLTEIAASVREIGAELIVFQLPSKEQLYFHYLDEVITGFDLDIREFDMTIPNRFLKSLCESRKIRYLDLFEAFSRAEKEVFFEYDEHLNPFGHEVLASALSAFLISERSGVEYLSQSNSGDRYPSFNGDGSKICFQSMRDGNMELFLTDRDLLHQTRLTFNSVDELHPSFFDNETKIVFTEGDQERGNTRISWLDLENRTRGYIEKDSFGAIPDVCSDKVITYAKWTKDRFGKMTLPVIAAFDIPRQEENIITSSQYESWRPVQWRDSIAYISKRNNVFGLYVYSRSSATESVLVEGPDDIWDPSFSPDGRRIVFSMKQNDQWDLFLMDLRDRELIRLTDTIGDEWDATFSPDGRFIYFAGVFGLRNGIYRMAVRNDQYNNN